MVIYNVSVKVETDSAEAWVKWMKEEHMPELLQTGLFSDCRLCRLMEIDESDGVTFSAQYFCKGMNEYRTYISDHAQIMRERGQARFGGKFVAFRSVMEVL